MKKRHAKKGPAPKLPRARRHKRRNLPLMSKKQSDAMMQSMLYEGAADLMAIAFGRMLGLPMLVRAAMTTKGSMAETQEASGENTEEFDAPNTETVQ